MKSTESQIEAHEKRLKQAMLQSDISVLDELLSPDLIFTNHLGGLMSKQDDLEAHQSGMLEINEISLSDQKITIHDNVAVVSVQAHIIGSYANVTSDSHFRFTRVWSRIKNETWQVIAGHSSIVV